MAWEIFTLLDLAFGSLVSARREEAQALLKLHTEDEEDTVKYLKPLKLLSYRNVRQIRQFNTIDDMLQPVERLPNKLIIEKVITNSTMEL